MSLYRLRANDPEKIVEKVVEGRKQENWEIYVKVLAYENLEYSILPQIKCLHCGYFGRSMQCPPYIPPYYWWREKMREYNVFFLVIGAIDARPRYIEDKEVYGTPEWRARFYAGNENSIKVKHLVNNYILEKVKILKGVGYQVEWFETGGGCRRCRPCSVEQGKRCKKSDVARPSPEATGIDVYAMMLKYDEIEIPPLDIYRMIGLIAAKIPNYEVKPLEPKPIRIDYELPFEPIETWDALDIYQDFGNCKCEKFSPILCKKLYNTEDLVKFLEGKKLYAVKLEYPITDKKGIDELYNYALSLHRQGVYWTIHLWQSRCPVCEKCDLKTHRSEGYKKVQNRRIPRCVKFLNLDPPIKGERIGYILL